MTNLKTVFACLVLILGLCFQTFGQSAVESKTTVPQIEGKFVQSDDESTNNSATQKAKEKKTNRGKTASSMDHFMRVRHNQKRKPVAFETSVTRYITENADGDSVYVDLIGVVHIGEPDYYERLNKLFKNYDSVLFELVAPEGTVIPKGGERENASGLNPIAALQMGMKSALGLEFQLEHVDYEVENMVHADMSPEEFMDSMKNNDESFTKMFFKAIGQSMAQSGKSSATNFDLLKVAFAKDKEMRMRQLFATQMMDMEGGMAMFEGRDGSTIINHRNGKAMEVLSRKLDSGSKKISIFYGAGHLPDMERRLESDFKMKRAGQFWLEAWKLRR